MFCICWQCLFRLDSMSVPGSPALSVFSVCRCYAHALKLMSEVPSLWYDLGLNYYHQTCLLYPTEEDQSSQSLVLEKAQQVNHWSYCMVYSCSQN